MKALRVLLALALIVLVAAGLVGCGEKAAERAVEEATGGDVDVDKDGDSVTITTDEGEATIAGGEGTEVPDTFPDDVPLYDGTVVAATSIDSTDGEMHSVSVETNDDVATVKAWFEQELPDNGWSILATNEVNQGGTEYVSFIIEKGDRGGNITITVDSGTVTVGHVVAGE